MDNLVLLPPCIEGRVLARIKRFTILFEHGGQELLAHTNNSGAMTGILYPGQTGLFSCAPASGRKLPYTLERLKLPASPGGDWVGVNTLLANKLLEAAFQAGKLEFCAGYTSFRREVKRGGSRFDGLCSGPGLAPLWIECKSVTLLEDCRAAFPDAISDRAQKHLRHLMEIVASGERAALFHVIQRPHARCFGPADYVDAAYAELFAEAVRAGVEMYGTEAVCTPRGTGLGRSIPLNL